MVYEQWLRGPRARMFLLEVEDLNELEPIQSPDLQY